MRTSTPDSSSPKTLWPAASGRPSGWGLQVTILGDDCGKPQRRGSSGRRRSHFRGVRQTGRLMRQLRQADFPPVGVVRARSGAGGNRGEPYRRRLLRRRDLRSRRGKATYRRRGQTAEPFNEWFKSLFELNDRVWHRGLENNQTQLLAALFAYQTLVRYNHRQGNDNGQVQWIMDRL